MAEQPLAVGIDVGGTRIKAVCVRPDGSLVRERIECSADNADVLVRTVAAIADDMAPQNSPIGVCAPGLAARDNRSIAWMRGRMEAVEGRDWSCAIGRDVWVLNDGHAAALGESWLGAARDAESAVVLTLGTGVGGGVVLGGRVLQGACGRAGHLGHITLNVQGAPDIVGMPGSLEDCIGNHNVEQRTNGRFKATSDLIAAATARDADAIAWWRTSIRGLAVAIASLVNAFDPHIVVLGGGIATAGSVLFGPLLEDLEQVEWRPTGAATRVAPAELGEFAGAYGAARFALLQLGAENQK